MSEPGDENERLLDLLAKQVIQELSNADYFPTRSDGHAMRSFHQLRSRVKKAFYVPETSITTLASRVLFLLAHARRPSSIVGIGTYFGNALVWLCGPSLLNSDTTMPRRLVGCDIDAKATAGAQRNFRGLPNGKQVECVCEDGIRYLERFDGPIDLLFIDIDAPKLRKSQYLDILQVALPHLRKGSLILAHDCCLPKFESDLAPYMKKVRDTTCFRKTVTLKIDPCGLEVTLV